MIRILLPWPPRELQPECSPATGHRSVWSRSTWRRWQRITLGGWRPWRRPDIPANIKATVFTFRPPDRRRRDLDNLLSLLQADD
jgi:hypothetical protein